MNTESIKPQVVYVPADIEGGSMTFKSIERYLFTEDELVERDRGIAEKAWDAAWKRYQFEHLAATDHAPDRETFIESIVKPSNDSNASK